MVYGGWSWHRSIVPPRKPRPAISGISPSHSTSSASASSSVGFFCFILAKIFPVIIRRSVCGGVRVGVHLAPWGEHLALWGEHLALWGEHLALVGEHMVLVGVNIDRGPWDAITYEKESFGLYDRFKPLLEL